MLAVRVEVVPDGRSASFKGPIKAYEVLEALGFTSEEAVVIINGRPVPETYVIPDGSEVRVVRVLSGG